MPTSTLEELSKAIKEQNTTALLKKSNGELKIQLGQLNDNSNENSRKLNSLFGEALKALDNPKSNPDEMRAAEENINTIKELADTEEQTREASKINKEQNTLLNRIATGVSGLAGKFAEKVKNNAGGILGMLTGLALLALSPEQLATLMNKLKDFVVGIIDYIKSIDWEALKDRMISLWEGFKNLVNTAWNYLESAYNAISAIIDGDWATASEEMEGHFGGLAGLLAGIALSLGLLIAPGATIGLVAGAVGKLGLALKAFGTFMTSTFVPSVVSALQTGHIKWLYMLDYIKNGFTAFRIFMTGTFIPAIVGMLQGAIASMTPILVAAAPFIIAAAAIGAVLYALYEMVEGIKARFEEGSSIGEILMGAVVDLLTAPARWIKNITAWILDKLGFENASAALRDFNITDTIMDGLYVIMDWFTDTFSIANIRSMLPSWAGGKEKDLEDDTPTAEERRATRQMERDSRAIERASETTPQEIERAKFIADQKGPVAAMNYLEDIALGRKPQEIQFDVEKPTGDYGPVDAYRNTTIREVSVYSEAMVKSLNGIFENTKAMLDNRSDEASQPIIISSNGGNSMSSSTNNVSASNYNISNGISADDLVRRDFTHLYA